MNVRLTPKQKIKVINSDDIYLVMQQILLRENKLRRGVEHFWAVGLDTGHKVLFVELISLGASNRVQVAPPEMFRMAIYKLAHKVIMVHNHPSGNMTPSKDDTDFTDRMIKSGKMLNIDVIDHMIISEKEYFSFEDDTLMDQLRQSGLYELVEREKKELKEFRLNLEREIAKKEEREIMAKRMKDDGTDIDYIKKITGLSKWDIKKL